MKNIYFYLLLMTSTLIARDNPFIASDAYNEEVARLMEENDDYPIDSVNNAIDYENTNSSLNILPLDKVKKENVYEDMTGSFPKAEPKKIMPAKVMEKKKEIKKDIKKIVKKEKVVKKKKRIVKKKKINKMKYSKEQIIFVKRRSDLTDYTKTY